MVGSDTKMSFPTLGILRRDFVTKCTKIDRAPNTFNVQMRPCNDPDTFSCYDESCTNRTDENCLQINNLIGLKPESVAAKVVRALLKIPPKDKGAKPIEQGKTRQRKSDN